MQTFIAVLVTAILLTTPKLAVACTIFPDDPSTVFRNYDSVFLAHPLEISPGPDELGQLKESVSYQQTVTWRVTRSWKGRFADGDTFVTVRKIDQSDPCSGWGVTRGYEPKIFHSLVGSSPHTYDAFPMDIAILQLNALEEEHERTGE